MTDQSAVDALRAALDATLLWDAVTSEGFDIGPTDCERIAARYAALAASATEGPTRLDVALDNYGAGFRDGSARPAVPEALDVERLAEAIHEFQSGIGWDRRKCSGGRDHLASAAGIADEYAALSEPSDD